MRTRLVSIFSIAAALSALPAGASQKSEFFKTSDGTRIHYLDAGNGSPIVFIPGWTMPAWIWQKQIEAFSSSHRVVAIDPRSQGESDKTNFGHLPEDRARDYKQIIDHLALNRPVLVGWSMACGEIAKYVEQYGSANIAGIVLVDGFLADKPNPEMFTMMSGWMNQLQQDRRKQADSFVRSMFKKPQPEEYLQRLVDASVSVPADTAAVLIYNMTGAEGISAGVAKMGVPVLFAYQPQTKPTADFLKAKLGDHVRLELFESDGHALFVDDPDKFNRVLQSFLDTLN